jgi:hypothetical protein
MGQSNQGLRRHSRVTAVVEGHSSIHALKCATVPISAKTGYACSWTTAPSSLRYSPNGYLNPPPASFKIFGRDEYVGVPE